MIIDAITHIDFYVRLNPRFSLVHEFLRKNDPQKIAVGRHMIDGDHVFAIIEECSGKGRAAARLETHRKYCDIQFCIKGSDEIGMRPRVLCQRVAERYDDERDIEFYSDPIDTWVRVNSDICAIFFPEDGHAPLAGAGDMLKCIVKVAV